MAVIRADVVVLADAAAKLAHHDQGDAGVMAGADQIGVKRGQPARECV